MQLQIDNTVMIAGAHLIEGRERHFHESGIGHDRRAEHRVIGEVRQPLERERGFPRVDAGRVRRGYHPSAEQGMLRDAAVRLGVAAVSSIQNRCRSNG